VPYFDRPIALLILAVLPLIWWSVWKRRGFTGTRRAVVAATARSLLLALLALALAQPAIRRTGEQVTVVVVADVSKSVPAELLQQAQSLLERAAERRTDRADRIGVVAVGRDAAVTEIPRMGGRIDLAVRPGDLEGSDLAEGVQRALAVLPPDTMNRILLVSDGNETAGSLAAAADLAAANRVPIDVLPITYSHARETLIESIRLPSRVRSGQAASLRIALRSQGGGSGTLLVWENDQPIDLDPASPGAGRRITLPAGPSTIEVPLSLDRSGARRFRALFEPDAASGDGVLENNRGATTTFVSGEGSVLVIHDAEAESASLVQALQRGGLTVDTISSDQLVGDMASLSAYDAVVLSNVPRYSIDNSTDKLLRSYVHDLGGGLLVTGGDNSFGAGGWIGSALADALPVKLDPPASREMMRTCVAVVIDTSGSMCNLVSGTGRSQQEEANDAAVAGLRSMTRLDEIIVVAFNQDAEVRVPRQQVGDGKKIAASILSMQSGGGTDQFAGMELAIAELLKSKAATRHMVILTDGQTTGDQELGKQIVETARRNKITISTIGVGDGSNDELLAFLAQEGGGEHYSIDTPAAARRLPAMFIREMSIGSRNLIADGIFQPQLRRDAGGPVAPDLSALPPLGGSVITVPRDGLSQYPIVRVSEEGTDPILAHWNHGLGKVVAFTSDTTGRWGSAWVAWSGFQPFWERVVRWLMRPAAPDSLVLRTRIDGDDAVVELDATGMNAGSAPFGRAEARIVMPNGTVQRLPMVQKGLGRFEGRFTCEGTGSYLVDAGLSESGAARASGSVQACVSVPYSREYRMTRDNSTLLTQVAEQTGGRVLSAASLASEDLFDRSGLTQPRSVRQIWDILAIIAAALLVIDVAARRLVFDAGLLRDGLSSVTGVSRAGRGETIAAWKRARAASASGSAASSETAVPTQSSTVGSASTDARPAARSTARAAPETKTPEAPDAHAKGSASADSAPRAEEEESNDPLSRLRRAKRRAKEEMDGDQRAE